MTAPAGLFGNYKGTTEAFYQVGLGGAIYYEPAAANPTTPTPVDGSLYYNTAIDKWMAYDGTRSKWLSVESATFQAGRNGNTGVGVYYRGINGQALSAVDGYTAPFDGTVVEMGYTRQDTDAATFEITAGGTAVATLASAALKGKSVTLDGDFSADDVLAARNQTGGNTTSDVQLWFKVRWRT